MVILIVDDEHSVISSITNIISQNFEDVFEIYTASSAEAAYEICQETKIDLLITDIRMPGADGIALADEIITLYPQVGIIFVSAYDQKEYLKAAIKLNAVAFVDKPVVPEELTEAIRKYAGSDYVSLTKKLASAHRKKANIINLITSGRDPGEETEKLFKKTYGEDISSFKFGLALVKTSSTDVSLEVGGLINSHFANRSSLEIIYDKKSDDVHLVLLILPRNADCSALKEKEINVLYEKISAVTKTNIVVADFTDDYKSVRENYVMCSVAMEKSFYTSGGVFYADSDLFFESEESFSLFKILDDYTNTIRLGVKNDIVLFLEKTYNSIKEKKDMPIGVAKFLFKQFIYATYTSYSGIDSITFFDSFDEIEKMDFMSFDELYEFTLSKILYSYDSVNSDKLVVSVKRIIETSYSNPDFSVMDICDELHLSASHISSRFKKTMGITLNNYITMVRLSHACTLIKSGKYSSNEISFMVGYNDSNYFSRIFKNHFGMTVTEYRKENAK
jgi:two-component system response regulator YesN